MSDKLKSIFPVAGSYSMGEQPTAQKLSLLNEFARNGFTILEKLLGPLVAPPVGAVTSGNQRDTTRSSVWHLDDPTPAAYASLQSVYSHIFNLTRMLGSAAVLNPAYLGNETFDQADQGAGYPLLPLRVQQLPFRPTTPTVAASFTFTLAGTDFANLVASPDLVVEPGDWFCSDTGLLYSYRPAPATCTVAYDLETDQGDSFIGACYNVIPDPSVLRLTDGARDAATFEALHFGACKLIYNGIAGDSAVFDLYLPEVISVHESLATGDASIDDFEPAGHWSTVDSLRVYQLNPDLYVPGAINDNTLQLWDQRTGKLIEPASFYLNVADLRHLTVSLPLWTASGPNALINDDATILTNPGTYNSKHFFLLAIGTQLTNLVSQLRNHAHKHQHNGVDSMRLNHADLAGNSLLTPGWPGSAFLLGAGLDLARVYGPSEAEDAVHPQFLHRLGYRFGGTAGTYDGSIAYTAAYQAQRFQDLNMLEGDLVLGPVTKFTDLGVADGPWDHTGSSDPENLAMSDAHSFIWGFPGDGRPGGIEDFAAFGASRQYYSAEVNENETNMHIWGLPFGDTTSGQTSINRLRGSNWQWGNWFFGYDDSIYEEPNAGWLVGEFNIVTTGHAVAGTNTSNFRKKMSVRDGLTIRAVSGSSIYLGVGGPNATDALTAGQTTGGKPGAIVLETAYDPIGEGATSYTSLIKLAQDGRRQYDGGAILLGSPAPFASGGNTLLPWSLSTYQIAGWFDNTSTLSSGWGEGVDTELLGGFYHMAALAPRSRTEVTGPDSSGKRKNESPKNGGEPWGALLFEATRHIDVLVHSVFNTPEALSGWANIWSGYQAAGNQEDVTWNKLGSANIRSDYGEMRLWGIPGTASTNKATIGTDLEISASEYAPNGLNLNLLFKYGESYRRFGTNTSWNATESAAHSCDSNDNATWTRARIDNLGARRTAAYGSNIRAASTIEAFNGFRSDPYQPYTASYRLPFKQRIPLGTGVGDDIDLSLGKWDVILETFPGVAGPTWFSDHQQYGAVRSEVGSDPMNLIDAAGNKVWLDHFIRWHDYELRYMHGTNDNGPGDSLLKVNLELDYFYHATDGAIGSLGSAWATMFDVVRTGATFMEAARHRRDTVAYSFATSNLAPARMPCNGPTTWTMVGSADKFHGYSYTLGLRPVTVNAAWTNYQALLPASGGVNNVYYAAGFTNCAWALAISGTPDVSGDRIGAWPFRIYMGDANGYESYHPSYVGGSNRLWMEMTGFISLDFITQERFGKLDYA